MEGTCPGPSLPQVGPWPDPCTTVTRHPKSCALKESGLALARRSGLRRAKVAVARKLAVVMHCVWKSGEGFRWPGPPAAAAPEAAAT